MSVRLLPVLGALACAYAAPAALAQTADEPRVEHRVAEDDHVRVEEWRVRGETRRVVVRPKTPGAREYELLMPQGVPDPSQRRPATSGERVWRLFSF